MSELSDAIPATIKFQTRHLRCEREAEWGHDLWLVTINGTDFEFRTGLGHRKLRRGWTVNGSRQAYNREFGGYWADRYSDQASETVAPSLADVLYCLLSDSDALECSFDEWASNLGYDTDSRKALDTYLKCQESGRKLRQSIGNETFTRLRGLEH